MQRVNLLEKPYLLFVPFCNMQIKLMILCWYAYIFSKKLRYQTSLGAFSSLTTCSIFSVTETTSFGYT